MATTTFVNNLLNAAFRGATYTGGTITMKLYKTGLPSTTGVEVTGGSYTPQTVTCTAAASKSISSNVITFSNMPTGQTVVAYGVYDGATLIDENTLSSPFTADISTNELKITYQFALNA